MKKNADKMKNLLFIRESKDKTNDEGVEMIYIVTVPCE